MDHFIIDKDLSVYHLLIFHHHIEAIRLDDHSFDRAYQCIRIERLVQVRCFLS
ncbi:MAG TPA: hypothetical protein VJ869_04555 [Sphaerochaeta sp.]|nr:hypothetical protein [Sphaerochaeta sp.]